MVVAPCCTQVLQMKRTLQYLQVKFDEPIPIFRDNTNSIGISKIHVTHSKIKYILIKYHFFREHVAKNNINLEYVGTKEKIADTFTKPLPHESFQYIMLEIILRGEVNQYYQIKNFSFSESDLYTLLQRGELSCTHNCL